MADEFQYTGICNTMCWWNNNNTPSISCSPSNECINWTQPFLPIDNQIQTGFAYDQALLSGFFEPVDPLKGMNDSVAQYSSWAKFSPRVSSSSTSKQQMNFCNNTPFWNPTTNQAPPKVCEKRLFEDGSICTNMKASETKKNEGDQPATKKPRIAMPSPLPTFKVRKEKLGDRITALQQLVSPFGKTDTASVLQEAIDYIKFLHGQVGALSTPYLKNGHQMHYQKNLENSNNEGFHNLSSRGLCLVPISSTFAFASEMPMDFWAPTFLGNYL